MPRQPKWKFVQSLNYKWGKKGLEFESSKPNVFGQKVTKRIFDITKMMVSRK